MTSVSLSSSSSHDYSSLCVLPRPTTQIRSDTQSKESSDQIKSVDQNVQGVSRKRLKIFSEAELADRRLGVFCGRLVIGTKKDLLHTADTKIMYVLYQDRTRIYVDYPVEGECSHLSLISETWPFSAGTLTCWRGRLTSIAEDAKHFEGYGRVWAVVEQLLSRGADILPTLMFKRPSLEIFSQECMTMSNFYVHEKGAEKQPISAHPASAQNYIFPRAEPKVEIPLRSSRESIPKTKRKASKKKHHYSQRKKAEKAAMAGLKALLYTEDPSLSR